MALENERVAWFNGKIVRESEVLIPFRDQGFLRGDAVFDMTRSFNGKAFRLAEHIARLYRSLRYLEINPGMPPAKIFPSAFSLIMYSKWGITVSSSSAIACSGDGGSGPRAPSTRYCIAFLPGVAGADVDNRNRASE